MDSDEAAQVVVRPDQPAASGRCYIDRLPNEILLEIYHTAEKVLPRDTRRQRKWSKRLRLVNKAFAGLLAPMMFKDIIIDAAEFWPYNSPRKCPRAVSWSHRIQSCSIFLYRPYFNQSAFFVWLQDGNEANFIDMFSTLQKLTIYGCVRERRVSPHGAVDEAFNFFLRALNQVGHLRLYLHEYDRIDRCLEGMTWKNLQNLEIYDIELESSCFQIFFSSLSHPLKVLRTGIDKDNLPAWAELWPIIKTRHNLHLLEISLAAHGYREQDQRVIRLIEQVEATFGGRAVVHVDWRAKSMGSRRGKSKLDLGDIGKPQYLIWHKDPAQHGRTQNDELHSCKVRPTKSAHGFCKSCGLYTVLP